MFDPVRQINALGQALWLDFISREHLESGRLAELVARGVSGMTSNPTIWQQAVATGSDYDQQIRTLARAGRNALDIYEALAVQDIAAAADVLRPVYNETHGRDGFVSIEVNPGLAHDTAGTVAEAVRLFETIGRPNVMIKVPATEPGIPAVSELIGRGINVNVTLIFSIMMYEKVMHAYADGLRRFRETGRALGLVSSVASFFVSRVDTLVDQRLHEHLGMGQDHLEWLLGRTAIANAKIAYSRHRSFVESEFYADLRNARARVQRPLWASTSTKNPAYPSTKYVDALIGPNTVNTLPPHTLEEVLAGGATIAQTIEQDLDAEHAVMDHLNAIGIDMTAVTDQLLAAGVQAFADSFDKLIENIESKRAEYEVAAVR